MSLAIAKPAHAAAETWVTVTRDVTCMQATVREGRQLVCKRVNAGANEAAKMIDLTKTAKGTVNPVAQADPNYMNFEMTDEESDTARMLFGCDCPVCVRSLRQLRSMVS